MTDWLADNWPSLLVLALILLFFQGKRINNWVKKRWPR